MSKYMYRATNMAGQEATGVFEAATTADVYSMLRQKNYYPLEIKEVVPTVAGKELEFSQKIPPKDMSMFCTQLATVLKAGVPLVRALEIMKGQVDNKKLKKVIADVHEKIQAGHSLADSFRDHSKRFSDMFINMIEAGEASGTLDASLFRLGISYNKEHKLKSKIKGAMIYPIILSVLAIVVVIILLIAVVPVFKDLFKQMDAELPGVTLALLDFSDFIMNDWFILTAVILLVVVAFRTWKRTPKGRVAVDKLKLTNKLVGKLNRKVAAARFTRTFSTLSASGLALPKAVEVTSRALNNAYIEKKLMDVVVEVNRGRGLARPLSEIQVFPQLVIQMINTGEESGTLDDLVAQTADFYEIEAEQAMQKMASLIEPAVIILMAGMVLFIILAVMMPMFTIYNLIG